MARVILSLFLVLLALIAPRPAVAENVIATYARWERLRDPGKTEISFGDGLRFMREHPDWPQEKIIRLRTEQAALRERPSPAAMQPYCTDAPPLSGRGMLACYLAGAGDAATRETWLRDGWVQGDFSSDEERYLLNNLNAKLSPELHAQRVERLLFEEKTKPADRILHMVPARYQPLFLTRIATITDHKSAEARIANLSPEQRRDAGLIFDRIQWRIRHKQDDHLADLFAQAPADVPYADLWWPSRAMAAREALNNKNFGQALAILAGHGDLKGEALADALWLKGWIILQFRNDPMTAYREFYALYSSVKTPVSKARAAYWAGRAAQANGNHDISRAWMAKAAQHPTVFYGQLAHSLITPDQPLKLPSPPLFTAAEKAAFENEEMVRAVREITRTGNKSMRDLFLTSMGVHAESPVRFAMLASLAHELGGTAAKVGIAKLALRKGVVLVESGWPRIALPQTLGVEPALALSITRQESEFDPNARSPANARGMMQLLPPTARHVAKKNGWRYTDAMLENPQQNIVLGTAYLGQIIRGFDGSYILGIASYNAGPSNARRWLKSIGKLPRNANDAVNWIEAIPYGETRNYVMRAMENMQVYRTLMNPSAPPQLLKDLAR